MTSRSYRSPEVGFALVAVLWLLLLLSMIAGIMLMETRSERRLAATGATVLQERLLAEAGINRAIMSLADASDPEKWRLDGTPRVIRLFDREIEVIVESESGKVDLNAAPKSLLAALFRSQGKAPAEAEEIASRVVAWRTPLRPGLPDESADPYRAVNRVYGPREAPFRSVDELRLVLGMSDELQKSIAPIVTVYSRTSDIDRQVATAAVLAALVEAGDSLARSQLAARSRSEASGVDRLPVMGEALTISARVVGGEADAMREAVVRLTGDRRQPFWVLTWK